MFLHFRKLLFPQAHFPPSCLPWTLYPFLFPHKNRLGTSSTHRDSWGAGVVLFSFLFPDTFHGISIWSALKRTSVNDYKVSQPLLQQEGWFFTPEWTVKDSKMWLCQRQRKILCNKSGKSHKKLNVDLQMNISTCTRYTWAKSPFLGLISAKLLLIAKWLPFWAHVVAGVRKGKGFQCLVKSYQFRSFVKHSVFIIVIFMHSLISASLILSGYFSWPPTLCKRILNEQYRFTSKKMMFFQM